MPYTLSQVAIQLYTLRDFCKTPEDLAATAAKVKEIGYQAVQFSGSPVPHAEAGKIFADAGLTVCATHEPAVLILEKPEEVVERLKAIGTKHTAYPHPAGLDLSKEADVLKLVPALEAAGKVLEKNGLFLSYHNHAHEFLRFGDSTVLDYIYKNTHLKAELDTYWVQFGGGDPATWIESMKGRAPLLHLKDYLFLPEGKPTFSEIGRGVLDWKRILASAEKAGVEWLIVEQDTCPGDPFESIKISFDYLKTLLKA
jgi:sugar phosphate isomerase/epimerase